MISAIVCVVDGSEDRDNVLACHGHTYLHLKPQQRKWVLGEALASQPFQMVVKKGC